MSILEIIALVSTIICVILSAKEHIWAWPTGIISAASLIGVYITSGMYANIVLQSIFVIQCIIGWYNWGGKIELKISSLRIGKIIQDTCLFVSLGCIYAAWDIYYNGRTTCLPSYFDGVSTALALLGNWYLTKKIIQAWPLFMSYNLIITILLVSQGIYLLGVLNIVLFFISFNGYHTWKRDLKGV